MEYTDYYVSKESVESLRQLLEPIGDAIIVDSEDHDFLLFVVEGAESKIDKVPKFLRVFDAEGGAWGFDVYGDGEKIGSGEFGENDEWGISKSDNGFKGDLAATAAALNLEEEKLSSFFNDTSVDPFCRAVGFQHFYMLYPHNLPPGVNLMSDL